LQVWGGGTRSGWGGAFVSTGPTCDFPNPEDGLGVAVSIWQPLQGASGLFCTSATAAVIPAQAGISRGGTRSSAFAEDDGSSDVNWGEGNMLQGGLRPNGAAAVLAVIPAEAGISLLPL
jgi:hypothetical protein